MSEQFFPIVTVICPTTPDRKEFNDRIYKNFLKQDYPSKMFLWDLGDGTVGEKRNRLCDIAMGEVIIHMDSDDIYASNWITQSVITLMKSEADIVGLSKLIFYNPDEDAAYVYTYANDTRPWVAGGTMCYWKNFWRNNQFPPININEDGLFLWGGNPVPKVFAHDYMEGFAAIIHKGNTCTKIVNNSRYRRCTEEEEIALKLRMKG